MACVVYNEAKKLLLNGGLDLDTHDIRVALVMSNTTVDTENDGIVYVDDFTTLDECDSSGYSRKALDNEAVSKDDANDRAKFDADDVIWTALAACTRQVVGLLVYRHVTNDADSPVIAYLEFTAAKTPDGSDFTVQFNSGGIMRLS